MKKISSHPSPFQSLFAELKAEQDAENGIDGTQTKPSHEDIFDEAVLLNTEGDPDAIDENDEEQIDLSAVSPAMKKMFE